MLVEDLMAQLNKCDPKARVLIENTDVFLNGSYEALCVNADKIKKELWSVAYSTRKNYGE